MLSIQTKNTYRLTALLMVVIIIGVQWGFYETYTSQFPNFINSTYIIHIHGALLMIWLGLLVVQPMLIYVKKAKLHRSIGKVAFVLGPLIILSMYFVTRDSYWRGLDVLSESENLGFMVLDIRGFFTFAIFWALAMGYRKIPSAHMRYMIGTGILAIGPGVGRGLLASFDISPYVAFTITDGIDLLIVGTLLGIDLVKKNDYKPSLVVFLFLLVGSALWQINESSLWQNFALSYAELFY
ncbi:YfhO family protein [Algoriphagus aquimarinus]|uniref:YfhO family protein n=1 Tax=Algoriphagus aquimarinus TaxID=237018 RepID=A0A5C7ASZ2_9BACT|nr:YfhO family protein [Algoriphagus aquimarinus]TXE11204.1 YfhO family protein [Algoriphagus aquimarinus]